MENGEPCNKKKTLVIGTHDGVFHCDEALACFLLKQLPEYADAKIVRSRQMNILDGCDIVVDVGGTYDKNTHRYDHHQRGFAETMSTVNPNVANKYSIKLSSAGLIYAHFGEKVIQQRSKLPDDAVKVIYEKLYQHFIQEIDAIDNGIPICEGEQKYTISTNLSSRVGGLNPSWNAEPSDKSIDEIFEEAIKLTGMEFLDKLDYYCKSWWPAKSLVKEAIENRFNVHPSGKIAELQQFAPWKQHFFDLEKEMNIGNDITFFLYKDKDWRVICVPLEASSFICRTFLKEEWRGLKMEELSNISGIPGCIFCHHSGFIGGNSTREGVLEMAVRSLP